MLVFFAEVPILDSLVFIKLLSLCLKIFEVLFESCY